MSAAEHSTPTSALSSFDPSTNPTTAPSTVNGDDTELNGDAESSKMASQTSAPQVHAVRFTEYIFNVGYLQQQWADVQLTFFSDTLKLHRIILARSPFLAQYMMNAAPGTTIHLQFRDDNITSESVHACIRHLYSPAFHLITPSNARAVLATSLHLGGMPDLAHQAYTVCRESIRSESLSDWVSWVSTTVVPPQTNGFVDGMSHIPTGEEAWEEGSGCFGRYGEYSDRLKQDIYEYLTLTLPSLPSSPSPTPLAHLLPSYTPLPFPLFKRVVESPVLPFKDKQAQFGFAKKAIALRKKRASGGAGAGMEEAAVLAFRGAEGGMAVEITRKSKKGRPALWKVEG